LATGLYLAGRNYTCFYRKFHTGS